MPTQEDAKLIVQLAQWGAMIDLGAAIGAILADDFDPDSADSNNEAVRTVLIFGETVGTLVKNDLLDQDLVLDWIWASGLWNRVEAAVHRARGKFGEAKLYENFEALAKAQAG